MLVCVDFCSCFVPSSEPQATMTGRSWRLFCVVWPIMVDGLIGVPDTVDAAHALVDDDAVAPTVRMHRAPRGTGSTSGETFSDDDSSASNASFGALASDSCSAFDDGWRSVPGDDSAVADDHVGVLPSTDLVASSAYAEQYGAMPLHDAYLAMFCQAARLGGLLFGDNIADTTVTTEETVVDMEEACIKTVELVCSARFWQNPAIQKSRDPDPRSRTLIEQNRVCCLLVR